MCYNENTLPYSANVLLQSVKKEYGVFAVILEVVNLLYGFWIRNYDLTVTAPNTAYSDYLYSRRIRSSVRTTEESESTRTRTTGTWHWHRRKRTRRN